MGAWHCFNSPDINGSGEAGAEYNQSDPRVKLGVQCGAVEEAKKGIAKVILCDAGALSSQSGSLHSRLGFYHFVTVACVTMCAFDGEVLNLSPLSLL